MGMKISVGLQKKVGQPNYGSLGASCHVEFEISMVHVEENPERFQIQVRKVFAACHKAVQEEIARQSEPQLEEDSTEEKFEAEPDQRPLRLAKPATSNQLRAIHALARRHRVSVLQILEEDFGLKSPEHLTKRQASDLIDQLKTVQAVES